MSVAEVVAGFGPTDAANNKLYASWHLDSRDSTAGAALRDRARGDVFRDVYYC
ncbi:MAG: hypothetical protein GDA56_09560 [Hormoscilla sp. GM7CHS1pb]|nr:hypothetical protein [Hormoscilla sp. GM7CHS1pb]